MKNGVMNEKHFKGVGLYEAVDFKIAVNPLFGPPFNNRDMLSYLTAGEYQELNFEYPMSHNIGCINAHDGHRYPIK